MSLRHALLGLLAEHPASGYDLIKQFETSLAMVWPAQQSQVCGELTRLDENGLIEVTGTGARNRREYGITDAGREELRRWLTQPDVDIAYRSAALLRVFFLWTLNREEATKYLDDFAEHNRERLAALESVRDNAEWVGDPVQVCGRLALEFGIRGSKNGMEWGQWATEQLTGHL
ncbi:MAG TPA: PadR family transcriptional regulator [Pseudonocardiaceae bacterium]|jgi:DNA-binding PadR family transcriptional regulator|nr:PadR family transcriptional regulator [Pseudonocardiaceae bacterium]